MPDASPPEPAVRPATATDATDLARLRWEWRANEGRALEMDAAEFQTRFAAWVVDHRDSHRPFVATIDGRVAGIAWLALVDRVPGPDRWERRSAMVQAVYVTPAARGAGIGRALVGALVEAAHELGCDYLTVHPSQRSFPLYQRLGFRAWDGVLELDVHAHRMR